MGQLYPNVKEYIDRNHRNIIAVLGMLTLLMGMSIAGGLLYHHGYFEPPEDDSRPESWVLHDDSGRFATDNCSEPISYSSIFVLSPQSDRNLTNSILSYTVEIDSNLTYSVSLRINDVYIIGQSSGFNGSYVNYNDGVNTVDLRINADSSCTMSIDLLITVTYISTA